jgi:hypothetical protein
MERKEANVAKFAAVVKRMKADRRCFVAGSDAWIIMSGEEAALIRLSHEQNVQMKLQRFVVVITGGPRHSRGHAAKSSTAQAQFLRPP